MESHRFRTVQVVPYMEPSEDDQPLSPLLPPWNGPRAVFIPRTDQGYGFTLRHFIVYPPEFSLQDQYESSDDSQEYHHGISCKRPKLRRLEPMETIFVKHVKEDSVAQNAGLNEGDRILSINNIPIIGQSYPQVISLIQTSDEPLLKLDVLPRDEDVLQMAYQNTNRNSLQEPLYHSRSGSGSNSNSVKVKGQQVYPLPSQSSQGVASSGEKGRYRGPERRFSASSLDEYGDSDELNYRYLGSSEKTRKMKSSTSYTSGLSVYREPQLKNNASGSDLHKVVFNDRRRQFESRAKENVQAPSKTYTLGLYYPAPKKEPITVKSSEGVPSSSSHYRRSADNILQSNDSLENITRSVTVKPQGRVIPLEQRSSAREGVNPSQDSYNVGSSSAYASSMSSSSSRHSYPDSSSALANQNIAIPHSYTSQTNMAGDKKGEHHLTRHYVPVVSQTSSMSVSPKLSTSVDGLDSRSGHYITERSLRTNYSSPAYEQQNQNGGARTFIVKIGNKTIETGGNGQSNGQVSGGATVQMSNQYGSTFALTKSPHGAQIEIKQKDNRERPPMVSYRKQQFESGQNDNSQGQNSNRYKTEIKKITSGKFTTVQNRLQNFEKEGICVRRMSSTERYSSPEPSSGHTSHSHSSERSTPQPQTPQQQQTAPIRIYVSQGTPHSSPSPLVEIMPMPIYQDSPMQNAQPMEMTTSQASLHMQEDDVDGMSDEEDRGNKPVRQPSFLAAINQPPRYGQSVPEPPSPDSPPVSPSPWMGSHTSISSSSNAGMMPYTSLSSVVLPPPCSDAGLALTSTPIRDSTPSVMLRKKSESTPEEDAIKLQRRTSYLMATAKDRDSHKLSLDKSQSPNQSAELTLHTPNKHHSMKKLKAFFGERTPRIMEATEKRQDPASPIQEVAKEGTLHLKTDITDGKRSSDRSWKPVWVELRGHALYLHKERKEQLGVVHPFSFEDQPISIKSAIVDIAYDYTKKKNVFRLKTYNGSEYLFQAEEHEAMLSWIRAIQENNDPDSDERGLASKDLIIRKTNQHESAQPPTSVSTNKTSPQAPPKAIKKLQSLALKPKIPHSPSMKRKKAESKDDNTKAKTLKGKLKSFRKHGVLGSGHSEEQENSGMFGVPLSCCIPSPNNDFVPLIVDLCTKIVEARGLESTGVYRVPGNSAAVNHMQDELNKGIDNMNVDHEKWCDVNVISSLLKAFFRKLPDPLITTELYQSFINANQTGDPERRMLKVKRLLHDLPEHHFETFRHLAEHLNKVASYDQVNKMDTRNLALMFGPTLIRQINDDMASIVKDMSDQCRIVESIISHYEWFFSSWDQDRYVPVDENYEENNRPSNTSFSRMSCDDDDNANNPKYIVSSFVQAAKKRGKGEDEVDASQPPAPPYRERNIDQEVAKHRMKTQNETTQSSPNLTTVLKTMPQQIQVVVRTTENPNDRRMAKSQEILDPDWEYIDSERQSQSMIIKPRHYSEDSLDKNDEMELSSQGGLSSGFSVSRDTIDRLRKIEEEARALREKEEKRRRDFERRKLERQKVEQDIQRTKKEIEYEDSQNVEDLLNSPSVWHSASELHRYSSSGHVRQGSATSDYSSVSSGAEIHGGPSWLKYGNTSDYNSTVSPSSSNGEKVFKDPKHGGKYFVIQSVNSAKVPPTKRTNSLETMLETDEEIKPRQYARITTKRGSEKPRWVNRESGEHIRRSRGNLSRSNSVRRGSLDSLIDLLDRQDQKVYGYNSSDSEDGSDLLSDLTTTFDQKLKVLVNPKYKLNGSTSRLNKSDGSGSVTSDKSERSEKSEKEPNAHMRLPPQLPLSLCNKFGLCSSNDMLEKQYRDPSLHRSPLQKSEAKIGIAYRFERNPTNSVVLTNSRENMGGASNMGSPSSYPGLATEPRTTYMVVNPSPVTVLDRSGRHYSPSGLSQGRNLAKVDCSRDARPISKSEKTEVNVSLSKQVKDSHMSGAERPTGFSCTFDIGGNDKSLKARSSSPEPARKVKRTKRRHTVGSTNDEHFRALKTLSKPRGEPKMSAWDRLQPGGGKDSQISASQNLLSWMQNERLRASVPDLSVGMTGYNGNYS
ncbi:rho GTPase-activating protein 21-like isoform X2 [Mizuhopecten yessoensis]|uniref:Rho GTPase-activating protein 21 n=1 Tax=Mizuhopecten yessoensis TaxID=6573 RepID=A0A210Q116_MIZYE|nr:rho GTPase-activating protein 21-like isoform X2 [Mizuhopecten yessoensis]OWF42359.1 Rho GTPase-activating protein 21 [Mizuhopecten yessoensis]